MHHRPTARSLPLRTPIALLTLAALASHLAAQCQPGWQPGDGFAGTTGQVATSVWWDPDGDGPQEPLLVVGGPFSQVSNSGGSCVATYNPGTGEWHALGSLLPKPTFTNFTYAWPEYGALALEVLPTGELVAGGRFAPLDDTATFDYLVRWTGTQWVRFDTPPNGPVRSIKRLSNNDVIVGGDFTYLNGIYSSKVIRWRNGVWQSLTSTGGTNIGAPVHSIAERPDGSFAVAAYLSATGSPTNSLVAIRQGDNWNIITSGISPTPRITTITTISNGDLIAGGSIHTIEDPGSQTQIIARYDGSAWHRIGEGLGGTSPGSVLTNAVLTIKILPNDHILVGGAFPRPSPQTGTQYMALFDGQHWTEFGPPVQPPTTGDFGGGKAGVWTIDQLPNGAYMVGGYFRSLLYGQFYNIAPFQNLVWHRTFPSFGASPTNAPIQSVTRLADGRPVVGGYFNYAGIDRASFLAVKQGQTWQQLEDGAPSTVYNIAKLSDDSLAFFSGDSVYKWTIGGSHQTIGTLTNPWLYPYTFSLLPGDNADFYIAGNFDSVAGIPASNIAHWQDGVWSALGEGFNNDVRVMLRTQDGTLIAGGAFTASGSTPISHVARWDGSQWQSMGEGLPDTISSLAASSDGKIYATIAAITPANVADAYVWDGSYWAQNPGTLRNMRAFTNAPDGTVFAFQRIPNPPGPDRLTLVRVVGDTTTPVGPMVLETGASNQPGIFASSSDELIIYNIHSPEYDAATGQPAAYVDAVAEFRIACPPTCDPDTNQDGATDQGDIDALVNTIAGGPCP